MLDAYTLVHSSGELHVYDQNGDRKGRRQLWIYSTFQMPEQLNAALLLGILQFLAPEEPQDVAGFSTSQVQNCYRINTNCRYLFTYINELQQQVGELESTVGIYPPSNSVSVAPGIYKYGRLYFAQCRTWVHISSNLEVIKLAYEGGIKKVEMPSTVKSFSGAKGWKRRVALYLMEHK